MTVNTPLRWDLSNVYPGLDSPEFSADLEKLSQQINDLESYSRTHLAGIDDETPAEALAGYIGSLIDMFNAALLRANTLRPYINSFVATDSYNVKAKRLFSEFELVRVRLEKQQVQFKSFIGKIAERLPEVLAHNQTAEDHAFMLRETAEQSRYLMSESEEILAAELNLSGASAWGRLQSTVTSQLKVDFELDGKIQALPMPALINLHSHPDEAVRKRAYYAELQAWESVQEPLAAAMNGVKGGVDTLNRHRGRQDALHSAIDTARIDRETLEAMLDAMRASFPMFRRYFQAKAARLGKEKLPWWDVFAPTGKSDKTYSFLDARDFILEHFGKFSPELSDFASRAFDHHWIDAEQRVGKRGGAFCMPVPRVKESRVLCNFDGTLDQVSTIAHELGHGFHNECMFQAGRTELQRITPMTMAETASILCETIVVDASLAEASSPEEELAILETSLIGDAQIIVDIYSRYLFEKEVFERRARAELSAEDLCEIMERAQKAAYGDSLDENYLHKYMWTWKPHYYYPYLSFYNFPYAFGLLFGIGLYAIYQQRGPAFVPDYKDLLAGTGKGTPAELAARFGIDIRQRSFWDESLKVIGKRIDRYLAI